MQIQFFFLSTNISLRERTRLKKFVSAIFREKNYRVSHLNYIFCNDEYLLQINKKHLNHDYYTDIITFDFSEKVGDVEGEIYISTDRVIENAATMKCTITAEIHRVIFHGALHLCGFTDKKPSERLKMRAAEDMLLLKYFKR